jgi:hypothetical protein
MSDEEKAVEPQEEPVAPSPEEHLAIEARRCVEDHEAFAKARNPAITAYYGKVLRETLHMRAEAYKAQVRAETAAILKELEGQANGEEEQPAVEPASPTS